jgi:hypothetical protein
MNNLGITVELTAENFSTLLGCGDKAWNFQNSSRPAKAGAAA